MILLCTIKDTQIDLLIPKNGIKVCICCTFKISGGEISHLELLTSSSKFNEDRENKM